MRPQKDPTIELRRHRNTLIVIGAGVIAFGFWSVMKTCVTIFLDPSKVIAEAADPNASSTAVDIAATVVMMGFDLILRLRVGLAAIRTGRGLSKKRLRLRGFYLLIILNVLIIAIETLGLIMFPKLDIDPGKLPDLIVAMIVDLTGLFILLQLLYAAIKVRQLTKEQHAV